VPPPVHPPPEPTWRHNKGKPDEGYWHFPLTYTRADPALEEATDEDSFESRYVRLIGGYGKHSGGGWSRGPSSFITLDGYSVGISHQWSKHFPDDLADFARDYPELTAWAFGAETAENLLDEAWMARVLPPQRGFDSKDRWDLDWDWFPAGWWEIAYHPTMIRWQVADLLKKPKAALKVMKEHGWTKESTLAALGRLANSRGSGGMRKAVRQTIEAVGDDEDDVIRHLYFDKYSYEDRYERIMGMFSSDRGTAPSSVSADRLDYDVDPVRPDGSYPRYWLLNVDPTSSGVSVADYPIDMPVPTKGRNGAKLLLAFGAIAAGAAAAYKWLQARDEEA